jgi:hypothetical protein
LAPYDDTKFIREFTIEVQKGFFKEIIENQVLYANNFQDSADNLNQLYNIVFTEDNIDTGCSVITMFEVFVVGRRYSKKKFIESVKRIFMFEEEVVEYIWGWFEGNKNSFFQHYLLRKMQLIQDKLDSPE